MWLGIALVVAGVVVSRTARDLDVVQLDDVTAQLAGVAVDRSKVVHLGVAVVLAACATATVGVISLWGWLLRMRLGWWWVNGIGGSFL